MLTSRICSFVCISKVRENYRVKYSQPTEIAIEMKFVSPNSFNQLLHLVIVLFSILASALLVNSNKFVLSQIRVSSGSAYLGATHYFTTYLVSKCNRNEVQAQSENGETLRIRSIVLITLVGTFSVGCSNLTLMYSSVSFHQFVRILLVPGGMIVDNIKERKPRSGLEYLCTVQLCVIVLLYLKSSFTEEFRTHLLPCIFAFLSIVSTLWTVFLIKHVCSKFSLSAFDFVTVSAPWSVLSAVFWCLLSMFFDIAQKQNIKIRGRDGMFIFLNCLLAVCVNISSNWCSINLSTLAYGILGQVKMLTTVFLGAHIFHDRLSANFEILLMECFVLVLCFSYLENKRKRRIQITQKDQRIILLIMIICVFVMTYAEYSEQQFQKGFLKSTKWKKYMRCIMPQFYVFPDRTVRGIGTIYSNLKSVEILVTRESLLPTNDLTNCRNCMKLLKDDPIFCRFPNGKMIRAVILDSSYLRLLKCAIEQSYSTSPWIDSFQVDIMSHTNEVIVQTTACIPEEKADKFKLTFCSNALYNQGIWLPQWLEYHISQGIDHFIFLDLGSTDSTKQIFGHYSDYVTHVDWFSFFPKTPGVMKAIGNYKIFGSYMIANAALGYNIAISSIARVITEFVGIWDMDEYLFSNSTSIRGHLETFFKEGNICGKAVQNMIFSARSSRNSSLVIDKMRFRAPFGNTGRASKWIARPSHIDPVGTAGKRFTHIHLPQCMNSTVFIGTDRDDANSLRLNHYWEQARDRCADHIWGKRPGVGHACDGCSDSPDKKEALKLGFNAYVEDNGMEKYVDLIEGRLAQLPQYIQITETEYKGHSIASKCTRTAQKSTKKLPKKSLPE